MTDKKQDLYYFISDDTAVWLMCFIGGFMDAAGYVKLKRLFVASATGNLIVAAASIYRPYDDVLTRVYVLLTFVLGVLVTTSLTIQLRVVYEWSLRKCAIALKCLEIISILLGFIFGIIFNNEIDEAATVSENHIVLVGTLLSLAMGIHVASIKNCMPHSPSTAVMTTNLVALSMNAVVFWNYFLARHSIIRMHPAGRPGHRSAIEEKFHFTAQQLLHSAWPILYFVAGAICGSVSMFGLAFWSLLVPIAVLVVLTIDLCVGHRLAAVPPPARTRRRPSLRREDNYEEQFVQEDEAKDNAESLDPELRRDEDVMHAADDIVHHDNQNVEMSAC
jgi:uncharacterized membrane protein YoaK (UPF0700 family)